MKSVALHNLGCKVNAYELEVIGQKLQESGYMIVPFDDKADIYIVNTCTVTNIADRKSRQMLHRAKKRNPDAVVVAVGCYVQTGKEEALLDGSIDLAVGNNRKKDLLPILEAFLEERERNRAEAGRDAAADVKTLHHTSVVDISREEAYEEMSLSGWNKEDGGASQRTRAYIKIQDGCNQFCSYCIIPYARGKVRSRALAEIVEEAGGLIAKGFKELILTGINTALYGEDLGHGGIEPLIAELDALPGDFRIRLSSLEPTVINASYVQRLLKYEKLCPHLHLSIQSGSDHVLQLMNRRYNRTAYLDIVKVLKEFDPLYGITTDIIVGFPGETEEDFADSLRIIDEVGFCKVHAFKYSPRKGTKAAELGGQISGEVKNSRSRILIEKAEADAGRFFTLCRGAKRQVLFEEISEDGLLTGYTDNYIKVYAIGENAMLNQFYNVKLLNEYKDGMKGEIVND